MPSRRLVRGAGSARHLSLAGALALVAGCSHASPPPALRIDPDSPETRAHLAKLLGTEDFRVSRLYQTSFESVDDFFGSYIERSGHMGSTYHELGAQEVHSGSVAHHAWITGPNPVRPPANTTGATPRCSSSARPRDRSWTACWSSSGCGSTSSSRRNLAATGSAS